MPRSFCGVDCKFKFLFSQFAEVFIRVETEALNKAETGVSKFLVVVCF